MRRNGQPSLPSAMTCGFFDSFKTLLMPTEPTGASIGIYVRNVVTVGRFSGDYHWPVLGDYRGGRAALCAGGQRAAVALAMIGLTKSSHALAARNQCASYPARDRS